MPIACVTRVPSTMMEERRTPRTPLTRELTGEVTVYRPLSVSDLSTRGARVETGEPLRVGSVRAFRLNLGDQTIVLKGRVAHAEVRTLDTQQVVYTSGVEFVDMSPAACQSIESYLIRTGQTTVPATYGGFVD